ncbi:winged helix-turn-helix domain-containing protein [Rhodococcus sp. NCIMB 12038]|uniref:winged helix-turn-helix domain-containing protein n=1 Tax=Rhodococcus sp. NCIMB 12038 TaxID=933800 RepID=UPI000B3C420D|nr:winged helix-turn-helix domain-containing protein [Rhodococcus sp. NCIMB 12038]OUS83502.1 hypothetical protein CA951_40740 [Rhodococcus sp. NCIMB 12038]
MEASLLFHDNTFRCALIVAHNVGSVIRSHLTASGLGPPLVAVIDAYLQRDKPTQVIRALRATGFEGEIGVIGPLPSAERVALLEAGADDVIDIPNSLNVIEARIRVMIRRAKCRQTSVPTSGRLSPEISIEADNLGYNGAYAPLTRAEVAVMAILARNVDRVVRRQHLLLLVWGLPDECQSNCLNMCIRSLRRKFDSLGAPNIIRTAHGRGYRLVL